MFQIVFSAILFQVSQLVLLLSMCTSIHSMGFECGTLRVLKVEMFSQALRQSDTVYYT